eukprot:1193517-Prorocentrum_minimum.AAC.3
MYLKKTTNNILYLGLLEYPSSAGGQPSEHECPIRSASSLLAPQTVTSDSRARIGTNHMHPAARSCGDA